MYTKWCKSDVCISGVYKHIYIYIYIYICIYIYLYIYIIYEYIVYIYIYILVWTINNNLTTHYIHQKLV